MAEALPSHTALDAFSVDTLEHSAQWLDLSSIALAQRVSRRWYESLASSSVWRRTATAHSYDWGLSPAEAEASAAIRGGWKRLVRREHGLARAWSTPTGLRERVLEAGHHHWVPSILMHQPSREMVTCSYDGTVRFWTSADAARPGCFKVRAPPPRRGRCRSLLQRALWPPRAPRCAHLAACTSPRATRSAEVGATDARRPTSRCTLVAPAPGAHGRCQRRLLLHRAPR
jgi:WD40 repeat protein